MDLRAVLTELHAALDEASIEHAVRHRDLADIARVLRNGRPDMARVREYFQLFDREQELEALVASEPPG